MLYRLMSRTVFTVAHRVVCENKYGRQFHQSRQPDRWPCVVAKHEEACPVRAQLGQGKAIYNRSHPMLTDAEMEVLPARVISLEVSSPFIVENGLIRRAKIG